MRRWLTPEAAAGVSLCRRLRFDASLAGIITGVLEQLVYPYYWEQQGALTPAQAAGLAEAMFGDYLAGGDTCMLGTLTYYITGTVPEGVLACDGGLHNRVDYPRLYAVLDSVYVIDADTFRTPDLRGRVVVGSGLGTGLSNRALAAAGGVEAVTLAVSELPAHVHSEEGIVAASSTVLGELPGVSIAPNDQFTGSTGADGAHENMQPFHVIHVGVWYK